MTACTATWIWRVLPSPRPTHLSGASGKDAAALQPFAGSKPYNAAIVYRAQAVGYGHLHDAANARKAVKQYDAMVEATKKTTEAYYAEYMDTDVDEARAWAAFAEGKPDEAIRLMRSVADKQDSLGKREPPCPRAKCSPTC